MRIVLSVIQLPSYSESLVVNKFTGLIEKGMDIHLIGVIFQKEDNFFLANFCRNFIRMRSMLNSGRMFFILNLERSLWAKCIEKKSD